MGSLQLGQPRYVDSIGVEVVDPPWFDHDDSSTCSTGYRCKLSDAALIQYRAGVASGIGQVAFPYPGGSLDYSLVRTITDVEVPYQGQTVHLVGAVSGHTSGTISSVCTDVWYSDEDQVQWGKLCQAAASYASSVGDSGGPVIALGSGVNTFAVGVHWGRTGGTSYFSALYDALDDIYNANSPLGTMDPTAPAPGALSITLTGPGTVRSGATCLYTATPNDGTAPFSYSWFVNGNLVDNNSIYPSELIYQNSGTSYSVSVVVTDVYSSGTNSKNVTISSGAPNCSY